MRAVIMAGGSGSRLWPSSRGLYPKQFLSIPNQETMLQATLSRVQGLSNSTSVICNEEHRFIVAQQAQEMGEKLGSIILEPVGKNTAPAIALAAFDALDSSDGAAPLLLVMAADHVIEDVAAFHAAVSVAKLQAEAGKVVTFGIVPESPHTGYGYIQRGVESGDGAYAVSRFVEKPDEATAQSYLDDGGYYWNSGMFLFAADVYLAELKAFRPDIYDACEKAYLGKSRDVDFLRIDADAFKACPDESIDYAVMEKTDKAVVVPLSAGWSDVGAWSSLWEIGDQDASGNVSSGDVLSHNTSNSYIRAEHRLVATVGLDNIVVVETNDAILVAAKDQVQDVKKIVESLKAQGRSEVSQHRHVYRPWGVFDSIDNGERYQVKRITVKPGAKLSVQMHHHRAEHWIVVSGIAKVTNGDKELMLTENQSTYIPVGVVHALENPGKIPLELIEVQSGSYLGEDDIVRFEDRYGRVPKG
ncbi:mannose-1-phosphate guanylyltransferase/mannose-6-phosphate isomerase [Spongiibacter sp. IMCC21906]|uniref:mannose-1-phosphate guanylyltransferase/mannose-6-phosphate isomerase n=1 Tax=Spongiibacter sp. IMCC21906 TaxID=1620392 RepID=UPI00062DF4B5|nr:mannose-1-phosphate guanylyltransferase/mannose-6-phosphate isomerase [Spongiibacter sp. IMCC21906]AKH67838.1 mannose-1-phosphate guanylyltransferase/mannose-6-phosphate isomerase [Spongiibacter sp. IMCC21906]